MSEEVLMEVSEEEFEELSLKNLMRFYADELWRIHINGESANQLLPRNVIRRLKLKRVLRLTRIKRKARYELTEYGLRLLEEIVGEMPIGLR